MDVLNRLELFYKRCLFRGNFGMKFRSQSSKFLWLLQATCLLLVFNGVSYPQEQRPSDMFKFYANQNRFNSDFVKTLSGEFETELIQPCQAAEFMLREGEGVRAETIPGNFVRKLKSRFQFSWDVQTDKLVSIELPSSKHFRYFHFNDLTKEVVSSGTDILEGEQRSTLIDGQQTVSHSSFHETQGGKVFESTQGQKHGRGVSPKSMFFLQDLSVPDYLESYVTELESLRNATEICNFSRDGDL